MTGAAELPSTLGGPGWTPRPGSRADDVAEGRIWSPCGVRSEHDRLRSLVLIAPPPTARDVVDAAAALMHAPVDHGRMRAQLDGVVEVFRSHDIDVFVHEPQPTASPNVVFARDLFVMTPEGAVMARPASVQRAGEEQEAELALARARYPIVAAVRGRATFEGADALWLDPRTVLVGVGFRTDADGAEQLRQVLAPQGVSVTTVPLGPGAQHLLGAVNVIDGDLAAVHSTAATLPLREVLEGRGVEFVDVVPDAHPVPGQGMNFVTVSGRHVVMPADNPRVAELLGRRGVVVEEVDIGEYARAAGGLACMSGVTWRAG